MLQDKPIDYRLLAKACQFYSRKGYRQVEVPWIVDGEFSRMTSPTGEDGNAFVLKDSRHMVCSAEQGFIEEAYWGKLDTGVKYFSVSPCFRNETIDETHSKWFVKLELFAISNSQAGASELCWNMIDAAEAYFKKCGVKDIQLIRTSIGFDIESRDLEIGSYGTRKLQDYYAAYGTGAALPRLQVAIETYKENYGWLSSTRHSTR